MEKAAESEICQSFLQWGSRKRSRGTKVSSGRKSEMSSSFFRKPAFRVDRRVVRAEKEILLSDRRNFVAKTKVLTGKSHSIQSSSSPQRNERVQKSAVVDLVKNVHAFEEANNGTDGEEKAEAVMWPKFLLTLSRAEKEHDFLVMKGTKLPLRPKKPSKQIQRVIHSVTPGGWLSELSHGRYDVKEKKCAKRPRGLRAMRRMETDSE
eukprot:TRINITY_DN23255_c0_g1_i1.p1 TRINITY_DN23255_c0_g1~~TRINITY_DN23255_c0_g1_i1.p1  ORF type:complete len:207 (+),score=33.71 TRINITY_DN23255_c0_g1_i1:1007-1627(+)